jgi:hypothetical protein
MSSTSQSCFCTTHKCNGKKIRPQDFSRHKRQDEERRRKVAQTDSDTFVNQVFRTTMDGIAPASSEAIWDRDCLNPIQGLGGLSTSIHLPTTTEEPKTLPASPQSGQILALFNLAVKTDHEIEEHVNIVAGIITKDGAYNSLMKEERWFEDVLHNIYALNPCGDKATSVLREAMIDRIADQLALIEEERRRRGHVANVGSSQNVFNSGEWSVFLPSMWY